jgi:acyl-coenzyme A thioesterase PaaI-like protein
MLMTTVTSSHVEAVGLRPAGLVVKYKDGRFYKFDGVTAEMHAALLRAPSKGSWLQRLGSHPDHKGVRLSDAEVEALNHDQVPS